MVNGINITNIQNLSFSYSNIQDHFIPFILFVLGMVIYSVFIFKFYRNLAKKNIFSLDLEQYNRSSHPFFKKLISLIIYIIKYFLLFPIVGMFWFLFLTILLVFLSKQDISNILLVSIALVSSVRITSYYNEDLSKDLAKMLPFALLGVFLVDINYFSFSTSVYALYQLYDFIQTIFYYLLFLIIIEFVMRILSSLFHKRNNKKEESI